MAKQIKNNGINYSSVQTITPSDSTDLDIKAFMVTDDTSGNNVAVKSDDMAAAVVMYCIKGQIYPVGGKDFRIYSTSTTADTIIAFV